MDTFSIFARAHPFSAATLVLISVFLLIWAVDAFFEFILEKIFKKTKGKFDDRAVRIIKRASLALLFLGAIFFLLPTLPIPIETLEKSHKVLFMIFIVLGCFVAIELTQAFFTELEKRTNKKENMSFYSAEPFLNSVVKILVLLSGVMIALTYLGIDLTPLIASAGVAGAVLAFAARDFVANLFGGVSVFFDKPYQVGDFVIVNGEHRGEVVEIGARSTKIKTRDNVLITIPNAVMVTNAVINETGFDPSLRVHLPLTIPYGSDLEKIEKILVQSAKDLKKAKWAAVPMVRYRAFGESGIELELLVTINEPNQKGVIIHELVKQINKTLRREKIAIPLPSRNIFVHQS